MIIKTGDLRAERCARVTKQRAKKEARLGVRKQLKTKEGDFEGGELFGDGAGRG